MSIDNESQSARRVAYIRRHYLLSPIIDYDTHAGWRADSFGLDGRTVVDSIEGASREEVCRQARSRWAHFNFEDEARAFDEIFSAR